MQKRRAYIFIFKSINCSSLALLGTTDPGSYISWLPAGLPMGIIGKTWEDRGREKPGCILLSSASTDFSRWALSSPWSSFC
jgi:hypothetical protein